MWVIERFTGRLRLYRSRWGIETQFGYLKATMKMAVLRSKTVDNVHSEVAATLLVHNLIWRLIHEAAAQEDLKPEE
ncbi:MAG: transposase, partial [Planctomycetota bacterium]